MIKVIENVERNSEEFNEATRQFKNELSRDGSWYRTPNSTFEGVMNDTFCDTKMRKMFIRQYDTKTNLLKFVELHS